MPHELSKDDIARSASGMIRAYGAAAEHEAAARARKFERQGVAEAARHWSAIVQAIGELRGKALQPHQQMLGDPAMQIADAPRQMRQAEEHQHAQRDP
jgi:hypothetical protein